MITDRLPVLWQETFLRSYNSFSSTELALPIRTIFVKRQIMSSGQKQRIWAKILLPAPSSSTGHPVFKIVLGGTAALRVLSGVGGGTSF
jgi:hypothetical protein